jgi:5-methylcytosine-specific restriction endonuclease McrA
MTKRSVGTPVLVINASYEPIAICTAKRALKMWAKGVARIEETYPHPFYRDMLLPSVVRLTNYRRVPLRKHTVSRRNILMRDRYTCQYCAAKTAPAKLTLDHVTPKSRGGQSSWENLVAACHPCNHRKGDRTPEEAGMDLLTRPRAMSLHTHRYLMRQMGEDEITWRKYLYLQ